MTEPSSSMNYWYPKIKDCAVPMSKTEIAITKDFWTWIDLLDGKDPLSAEDKQAIRDAAIRVGGYPVFMRSDQCSGKHSFRRTCYVENERNLIAQIYALVEENAVHDLPMVSLIVREYIEPSWSFKAFDGLPIASERRYFVRDGSVVCHHPYWPEDAICFWNGTMPIEGWRELLRMMNHENAAEISLLSIYATTIAQELDGEWSVDFMLGRNSVWYMIDMAIADQSYHPPCDMWIQ